MTGYRPPTSPMEILEEAERKADNALYEADPEFARLLGIDHLRPPPGIIPPIAWLGTGQAWKPVTFPPNIDTR